MDWRSLARNRWTWVAVAGGVAAGGVVLWRKRKAGTGSGGSSSPAASDAAGSSGGVGYFDSTGTDVAQQLGQYGQAVDQQLTQASQQWQQQYDAFTSAVQAKLDTLPTEAPAGPTSFITVQEGNHVDPILAQVRSYQPGFSLADLEALNPDVSVSWANQYGYISPSNPNTGGAVPVFNVGTSAQVKIPSR